MKDSISTTGNKNIKIKNTEIMKQVDYIKIKVENVEEINYEYLIDHPTIKNRYKIDFPKNGFDGQTLYGNNIDVYHNNNILYVSTSLPFLRHGHNYTNLTTTEATKILQYVSKVLGVDLMQGIVKDFEVGEIFHPEVSFKYMSNHLKGVFSSKLLKHGKNYISYGDNRFQLKVYEIIPNLKRKVSKKIMTNINFKNENAIKVEIKASNSNMYSVEQFLENVVFVLEHNIDYILEGINISATGFNYSGEKFDDVLYRVLVKSNKLNTAHVNQLILEEIDNMDISYAKKTARRNSLKNKQKQVTLAKPTSFLNLLHNRCGQPPLFDVEEVGRILGKLSKNLNKLTSGLNDENFSGPSDKS